MTVTAVRNDMWQDDERRNCRFSNDRTFYCVEMSTSYEHRSRLDDPPFATQVSSKKAFYPLTCDRSPILRSTHAAPAALVAKFASGNDFRDEASKISYVPRSSKIVTPKRIPPPKKNRTLLNPYFRGGVRLRGKFRLTSHDYFERFAC